MDSYLDLLVCCPLFFRLAPSVAPLVFVLWAFDIAGYLPVYLKSVFPPGGGYLLENLLVYINSESGSALPEHATIRHQLGHDNISAFGVSFSMKTLTTTAQSHMAQAALLQLLLDSLPNFGLQLYNNILANDWTWIAIASTSASIYFIVSLGWLFAIKLLLRGKSFHEVPVDDGPLFAVLAFVFRIKDSSLQGNKVSPHPSSMGAEGAMDAKNQGPPPPPPPTAPEAAQRPGGMKE